MNRKIILLSILVLLIDSVCFLSVSDASICHFRRRPCRGGKSRRRPAPVKPAPRPPPPPPPPPPPTTTKTVVSTTSATSTDGCTRCPSIINTRTIISIGIWNTIAGGDCSWTTNGYGEGNTYPGYSVINVFDQNIHTYCISYGSGSQSSRTIHGGINTGFYATLSVGQCVIRGFQFTTAGDMPNRDPLEITIEGSNSPSSVLRFGRSWTLIYNGTSGLGMDPGRKVAGSIQIFDNLLPFHSYRVLITRKRGLESSVQYAEFSFRGDCLTDQFLIHTLNDNPIGIWNTQIGQDSSVTIVGTGQGHTVRNIFDQNVNTHYMNYGSGSSHIRSMESGINTGFYVTLNVGHCAVNGFRFSTSSDSADRDPLEISIEGSNAPLSVLTLGRSWTYLYNGSTGLDFDCGRKVTGPLQIIDNSIPFNSFRILITKKRGIEQVVQYSEVTLYGQCETKLHLIDTRNDKGIAIWNTIAGQDSSRTCVGEGQIYSGDTAVNIFDQDVNTKYQNFGSNRKGVSTIDGGINTGFYVTLNAGYCLLKGFRFVTANDSAKCDPIEVTIEGSNASSTSLTLGKAWTRIYAGSAGLKDNPGRLTSGSIQIVETSTIFNSYRVLVSKKRGVDSSVQYSEVAFYGECSTYDEDGSILNMSKTLFVNGLSSDSVINIQLIDINQIPLGIIRSGDHLNVTAPVKYINIAFRNHHPRLHSFTVHHHITNRLVTIHQTNSYIFLTLINEFGEDEIDLVKLTGSSSMYKHGAEICAWKRKFEQHRQLFLNAFTNRDFSIIKHRIAFSIQRTFQVPTTDLEEEAVSRIELIIKNATSFSIDVITDCKRQVTILINMKLNNTMMKNRLINLREIISRNITRIQEDTYQIILRDIDNFPYNVHDNALDVFITTFETSIHFVVMVMELIEKLPEQYETFLKFPVPTKPCISD